MGEMPLDSALVKMSGFALHSTIGCIIIFEGVELGWRRETGAVMGMRGRVWSS